MGNLQVFSVIVLNWNGLRFLDACLSSLRGQTFRRFETIFVDNGSGDGSVEFVRENYPEARVVALERNVGFAGGNIAGYAQASGDWIVLLNNDTEVAPGWLDALRWAAKENPRAGVLASKMMYFDDRSRIDNCGFYVTRAGVTVELGRGDENGFAWSEPRKIFGACGGAVAYSRKVLEDVGFFDPDFFMTYEDLDLSFRAQLRGHECLFVPGAVVYHRYRATMANYPARQVYFSQRNIEFAYVKNMPLGLMLRYLPQRILYEVGGVIYFTRLGVGGAFLRAKLDAIRALPILLRKRREIQRSRKISNEELRMMLRGSGLGPKYGKFCSAWRRPASAPKPQAAD
jgi:GT2 family glycosyltransferase